MQSRGMRLGGCQTKICTYCALMAAATALLAAATAWLLSITLATLHVLLAAHDQPLTAGGYNHLQSQHPLAGLRG